MTTMKAIESRVRRKLRQEGLALCRPRSESMKREYGEYHLIHIHTNSMHAWHCDVLDLAKEMELIRPGEQIES
jgi:hypothetical protein